MVYTLHSWFLSPPTHDILLRSAATPVVNLTEPAGRHLPLVIGPNDYDINATFECSAPSTTTLWRVENYLLVDRDQFTRQGLSVLDPQQGESKLVFEAPNEDSKGGFPFVFEALDKCYFTLYCLAVEDSVNVVISDDVRSFQTVASCHCSKLLFMYICMPVPRGGSEGSDEPPRNR